VIERPFKSHCTLIVGFTSVEKWSIEFERKARNFKFEVKSLCQIIRQRDVESDVGGGPTYVAGQQEGGAGEEV